MGLNPLFSGLAGKRRLIDTQEMSGFTLCPVDFQGTNDHLSINPLNRFLQIPIMLVGDEVDLGFPLST